MILSLKDDQFFIDSQFYYMPLLFPNTMAKHKEGDT